MRIFAAALSVGLGLGLAGCQDSTLDLSSRTAAKVVVGASVPVALHGVEGLPEAQAPTFSGLLAAAAAEREIAFVDAGKAPRYRLRGYLDAYRGESGVTLAWVWDVFDAKSRRAHRVSGSLPLGGGADPWSRVDETALRVAAARGLDEIGQFLAGARAAEVQVAAR